MDLDQPLQKADFGAIYDQRDPRAYFLTLAPYEYLIPEHGARMFSRLLAARGDATARRSRVLDVCCSYGVVGKLLKTGLAMADLNAHYRHAADQELTREELIAADRALLEQHAGPAPVEVVGLDAAGNAVEYARASGALDAGVAENLEVDEPSDQLAELVAGVDLITITGGIGYVTDTTFARLLALAPDDVWVAAFCLRTYDYGPIRAAMAARGLQTECLTETFTQRRFTGPEEQAWAIDMVSQRGLDPTGKESAGSYHAEFHLSRPAAEVERLPLDELLGRAQS